MGLVFKTKTDADGGIERLKARLVACGNENEQLFGVEYDLTLAAVMELSTVKVILLLSMRLGVPAKARGHSQSLRKGRKRRTPGNLLGNSTGYGHSSKCLRRAPLK